jgi:hypothetical protein
MNRVTRRFAPDKKTALSSKPQCHRKEWSDPPVKPEGCVAI